MSDPPVLSVEGLEVGYGRALSVVSGVSLELRPGEQAVVLGANGAGKSTLLLALAGLLPVRGGRVTLKGADITAASPHDRVRAGLGLALEGHRVVNELTVEENLRLALYAWGRSISRRQARERLNDTYDRFEVLATRRDRLAGTMSGGEQQMLVIARLLIADAAVLLVDEPSLGLAPLFTTRIFELLARAREAGVATLVVEQAANDALKTADATYMLSDGRLRELAATLARGELARAYLS
jgi:branched-chain amino acid transport system ATP-binding protein